MDSTFQRRYFTLIIYLLLASFTFNTKANINLNICTAEIETLPTLNGGRIKPLRVHVKETFKYLFGKIEFKNLTLTQAYCLLSSTKTENRVSLEVFLKLEHKDTISLFDNKKSIHFEELLKLVPKIKTAEISEIENNSYKKDLKKILSKISLYKEITAGKNWLLPSIKDGKIEWINIDKILNQNQQVQLKLSSLEESYKKLYGTNYLVEYYFDKALLTSWAMLLTILALCALVLLKQFKMAQLLALLTIVIQTLYICLRSYISGRAPITNMYETVLFSGHGALLLALILAHLKKEKIYIYMGLVYNLCCLMMILFAGSMVSPEISPLVPVLRDNFWLSTHVTSIILSYSAFALSWILANTLVIRGKFKVLSRQDEIYYSDVIYLTLKFGVSLLFTGIILGGVWADYSWGRFWGWDPKETWSLIVLCIYMAILHGRYTNWVNDKLFKIYVASAFMGVMMAWFGVNYILASGLHSYGFSEGGAIFLGCFFTIQILILILTTSKTSKIST